MCPPRGFPHQQAHPVGVQVSLEAETKSISKSRTKNKNKSFSYPHAISDFHTSRGRWSMYLLAELLESLGKGLHHVRIVVLSLVSNLARDSSLAELNDANSRVFVVLVLANGSEKW